MKMTLSNQYKTLARGRFSIFLTWLALTGCALPNPPARPAVYDFGPGPLSQPLTTRQANLAPLALAEVETPTALDSTAVLYRLAYSDSQQLRPYTLARWSMPPAQLLRQRLREHLGQRRAVLTPGDVGPADAPPPPTLRLQLEEFSHLFESPNKSSGLLRLRVTLVQPGPAGERLIAQRSVIVQHAATTSDAPGGVRALMAATDQAAQEISAWLETLTPAI